MMSSFEEGETDVGCQGSSSSIRSRFKNRLDTGLGRPPDRLSK